MVRTTPKDPKEIFPQITTDYKEIFGDDLLGIILYGSAAGIDYLPGKSDINFMIVLSDKGIDRLEEAFNVVKKWQKKNVAVPLFLTEGYVKTSIDVFPIEYLNFQQNHLLVFGKDILEDLTFAREFLRLQCEREIKGKLLLLREAFLQSSGKTKALNAVINQSISAFIAIFEALLFLKNAKVPKTKRGIIRAAAEALDLEATIFESLLDVKEGKKRQGEKEIKNLFTDYLKEVRKLSRHVDQLGGKDE